MQSNAHYYFAAFILFGAMLSVPVVSQAAGEQPGIHQRTTGVVIKKGGALAVKVPDGSTYQLNPNIERRHGHTPFKEGDEVTVLLDENNIVIGVHHKGKEGVHTFVTGKWVDVGQMNNKIKLQNAEGERVFPLERLELKSGGIPEGTLVTVELNEAGTVIDLRRADAKH